MMKWKKRMLQGVLGVIMLVTGAAVLALLIIVDNSDLYANAKDYYATNKFCNTVYYYMQNTINQLRLDEKLLIQVAPKEDEIVYEMLDFNDIVEKKENIDYENTRKQSSKYSYATLCKEESELDNNIMEGYDAGEDYYFFYTQWKKEAEKNATLKSDSVMFLQVSKKDYMALLHKYGEKDEENHGFVFVNDKTSAKVSFCLNEDEAMFYSLNTGNNIYDYNAYSDIVERENFYFDADDLDWSTKENLEKSIITTAFATVKDVLSYYALQEWITRNEEYCEYYIEHGMQNVEFSYQVTLADKTVIQDEKKLHRVGKEITFYADSSSLDAKSEQQCTDGTLKVDKSICETLKANQISSMTIYLPDKFNVLVGWVGQGMLVYQWYQNANIIIGIAVVGILVCLFLLYYLLAAERKEPLSSYDKSCLEVRSLITVMVAGAVLYICVIVGESVGIELANLFFGSAILSYVILYVAVYYYIVSIFRNIYWKRGWKQCFLLCGGKQFACDIWNHQKIAKKTLICCVGYAGFNVLGVLFGLSTEFPIVFLILFIGNMYVWRWFYKEQKSIDSIIQGLRKINDGDVAFQIDCQEMKTWKELAQLVNHIGEGLEKAVASSIRDERLKAELITNVSHDIKTPLTSIINYVDLLKREGITEQPAKEYIEVLDKKSLRLKQLIEDLVEASKASTGNIELACTRLDMKELVIQTMAEFEDKFQEKELTVVADLHQMPACIYADGRRCFRIIENLFSNVYKYSLEHTRVYISLQQEEQQIVFCMKNISKSPLNIDPEELSQRFVRGEESRTTEGSGLGLSIAKSLTELQDGVFTLEVDGDLFKVTVAFPVHA